MEHLLKEDCEKRAKLGTYFKKFKKIISRTGLLIFFILYTLGGAKVFQLLEHPSEISRHSENLLILKNARSAFLRSLVNLTLSDTENYMTRISENLLLYEEAIELAGENGFQVLTSEEDPNYKWNFMESVFFASTIITTIGYGNIAPSTTEGRAFCIIYGFIGIPVTLTVIADLGTIFANLVLALNEKLKKICGSIKYFQSKNPNMSDKTKRGLIVVGATGALLIYMSLGAQLFIIVENWSFFEAFYFCFITMTTIGLGDLVPEKTEFMLVCTIYILIGLALTSTIIELIRRQYAESWEQMKALSYKLGELSGPLTEQLKKLGNHDMNLALNINPDFKELAGLIQLHRLEALYKMDPKLRNNKKLAQILQMAENEEQNEEEMKKTKVIQIVIYESSV